MEKNNRSSTNSTIIKLAAFVIVIAALMYAQTMVNSLLLALFISVVAAHPIIWLVKVKVPQPIAMLIVIGGIISIYFGFFKIVSVSISSFVQDAPKYEQNVRDMMSSVDYFLQTQGIELAGAGDSNTNFAGKILQYTASILSGFSSMLSNQFTILFLTIFLLAEIDSIRAKFGLIAQKSAVSLSYFKTIDKEIRHYLSIKTFTSLITGVLITVSLKIIGVDYAILWGLIAFLLNYIPTIGSIIAAAPAILFTMIQLGFGATLYTTIVFVVVNLLIGNIVEPRLMGRGLGLSTFIVFFSLIFWGFLLGTTGMFLSVPLMIMLKIIFENNDNTKWIAAMLGTKDDVDNYVSETKLKE